MYSVADYGAMIADRVRIAAYSEALARVARDAVVLDLGAGTGIFTLVACRAGARRVFAVEPDDALEVAREAVRANGFAGRVEFFAAHSTRVTLPEPASVVISDLRGVLPWYDGNLTALTDARRRLLAPGGVFIARRDTLWAAAVESAAAYEAHGAVWADTSLGVDLRAGRRWAANLWRKQRMKPEHLLGPAAQLAALDYRIAEDVNMRGQARFAAARAGRMHGWLLWFDAELAEGLTLSNAPGQPELIYGQAFFPLEEPLALAAGEQVEGRFRADLVGEDYVWTWETQLGARRFRQSSFLGAALSPARLRRRAAEYRPRLNEDGEIDRFILSLMGDGLTVGEIAARVAGRFPQRFATPREALTRVGELAQSYSE